jgi:hypothetical protein
VVTSETWRYEPLDPTRFPVGESPFRVRGLAFVTALSYVDTRLTGGRPRFLGALGPDDPFAKYYDQIFVVSGEYDASALLQIYRTAAQLKGVAVGRFIEERSRWSAASDTQGMWKPLLKTSSPEAMAERLHLAFNRYFTPTRARTVSVVPGRFEGELSKLPANMSGLYVSATVGFVSAALELAGAHEPSVEWKRPTGDGELGGIRTESARFVATWNRA